MYGLASINKDWKDLVDKYYFQINEKLYFQAEPEGAD